MGQVIWSPSALEDIVSRLIDATDRLADFPQSGRVIPEIGYPDCREIVYGAYRIMFRVEGESVWITGVVHGARDWNPGQR